VIFPCGWKAKSFEFDWARRKDSESCRRGWFHPFGTSFGAPLSEGTQLFSLQVGHEAIPFPVPPAPPTGFPFTDFSFLGPAGSTDGISNSFYFLLSVVVED